MPAYRRGHCHSPLTLPPWPQTETEVMFEELKASIEVPPPWEHPANRWISDRTWGALINLRGQLRHFGRLNQTESTQLGRQIHVLLKVDHQQPRMRDTWRGGDLQEDLKEAWNVAKRWYRMVEDRAPKPCYGSMEKQTAEREKLYQKRTPRGTAFRSTLIHTPSRMTLLRTRRSGWW